MGIGQCPSFNGLDATLQSLTSSGGKCGGTFIDRNLYKLLSERFGDAFTSMGPEHTGPGSPFMDLFELKKRDFSRKNPSQRPIRLSLLMPDLSPNMPDLAKYYDARFSWVLLTKEDMASLFEPVARKIVMLVDDQLDQANRRKGSPIRTFVLVGGLGSSPYIRESLQEWCNTTGLRLTTPWAGG